MKCPQCNTFQGVALSNCPNCNYQFAFNSSLQNMDDAKMEELITKIDTQYPYLYYTKNQWVSILQNIRKRPTWWLLIPTIVCIGLSLSIPFNSSYLLALGILMFLLTISVWGIFYPMNDRKTVTEFAQVWLAAGKSVNHLITSPQLDQVLHDYDPSAYPINRVIVVAEDIQVDLLVRNQLHVNYDALVISNNLYPSQASDWLEKNLPLNPQIPIFLLQTPNVKPQEFTNAFTSLEQQLNLAQLNYQTVEVYDQAFAQNSASKKVRNKVMSYQQTLELDLLPIDYIEQMLAQVIQGSKTVKPMGNQTATSSQTSAQTTLTQTLQQLRNNVQNTTTTASVPPMVQNVAVTPPQTTQKTSRPSPPPQQATPNATQTQFAQQQLNDLQRNYWKAQQQLQRLVTDYQKQKEAAQQKQNKPQNGANTKGFHQSIDQQIAQLQGLQKAYARFRQTLQNIQTRLQNLDVNALPKQATDIEVLRQQVAEVQAQFTAQLKLAQQEDLTTQLEQLKTQASWDAYQAQVKTLLDAQEKFETLEMQFLPYKEKLDEQAAELWQIFDKALAPLKDDKAIKAKTRDLIMDYAQQIKNLVKDKDTCDQMEAHYQASINELTTLTQKIEAWQNNHATDQMMDLKNKQLWLNYANYEEEVFWKTYRELLYNVKNPMIGIASPVQPPQQKQQWEQLYDILGL